MKIQKIFLNLSMFLTTALFLTVVTGLIISSPLNCLAAELKISADAAILIDAETGEVYYDKRADAREYPASLTKIMTAILALENGNLTDVLTISQQAARIEMGSDIGLKTGDQLTLEDMLKACLLWSGNDAALAVGEYTGGTRNIFLDMMNTKAPLIGAVKSKFVNTNGYSNINHYTTAYDLALISRYALSNPTFAKMVKTKTSTINWLNREKTMELRNTNKLLKSYPGCTGIKTGTAVLAGNCLAASATRGDLNLIAIVLNSRNRYRDAATLLDYGFNQVKSIFPVEMGSQFGSVQVIEGKEGQLKAVAEKNLEIKIPEEKITLLQQKVRLKRQVQAPVVKGQKLGEIVVLLDNKELGRINLVAEKNDKRIFWLKRIFD